MEEREPRPLREEAVLLPCPALSGVEVLRASYRTQSFAWHSHEAFAFGVIERGGLAFRFRGIREVAGCGQVSLALPGESHTGHGADREGWGYRMFYVPPELLVSVARETAPARRGLPPLLEGVLQDRELARRIGALHRKVEGRDASPLELQERLGEILGRFVVRHARWAEAPSPRLDGPVLRARALLEERFAEALSLEDLAREAGCSPFRLVRAFRETWGMPPHAWQLQLRVRRGQALLRGGWTAAGAAAELGFADQSHFSRVFRRIVGMPPGVYARQVRT